MHDKRRLELQHDPQRCVDAVHLFETEMTRRERLHHSISILGSGPILLASHLRCITRNIEIRIGELSSDTLLVKSWLHWLPRED